MVARRPKVSPESLVLPSGRAATGLGVPALLRMGVVAGRGWMGRKTPAQPLPLREGHCVSTQKESEHVSFQEGAIQAQVGSM